MNVSASSYSYGNTEAGHHHSYLVPTVLRLLHKERPASGRRLIDLGCGNGSLTAVFHQNGWSAVGIDPSLEGIANARQGFPDVTFEVGSAYDNLADRLGTFPVLASLEVVEHIYAPRLFAKTVYDLLEPGGLAIISTPYHSYLKKLIPRNFGSS